MAAAADVGRVYRPPDCAGWETGQVGRGVRVLTRLRSYVVAPGGHLYPCERPDSVPALRAVWGTFERDCVSTYSQYIHTIPKPMLRFTGIVNVLAVCFGVVWPPVPHDSAACSAMTRLSVSL
jgi:hypothetical protein